MSWTHVGTAFASIDAAANNGDVSVPGGTADGHLMELSVRINSDTTTITTPSGWTLIRDTAYATRNIRLATYRRIAASEPATYNVQWSANQRAQLAIRTYSGIDQSNPLDVESGATSPANQTTMDAPSVTTGQANELVCVDYATSNGATWTQSGSPAVTERFDDDAGGASPSGSGGDFTQVSAGATGTITATASVSGRNIGHTAAFKEAAAPVSHPPIRPTRAVETLLRM